MSRKPIWSRIAVCIKPLRVLDFVKFWLLVFYLSVFSPGAEKACILVRCGEITDFAWMMFFFVVLFFRSGISKNWGNYSMV